MPTSVIEQIRRMVGDGLRDGELLGRFVDRRDEAALAALVNRHGPMVWGVCRRLLAHHDAEDAFQATFIVLVKKAPSIAQRELVGNWLYGVAHQIALQARRAAFRRKEVQVIEMPDVEAAQDRWQDLQPLRDERLSRLPDHYRAVIVLSDLEGKTRKEVAAQLGCPEGTVASRLVRARSMLARRLTQRGVALSGGALAAVLSQNVASAGVPTSVVTSTIKAASLCAAGKAAISIKVAALTEGVLKAMLVTKLKSVMAIIVAAAMIGMLGFGFARGQQKGDAVEQPKARKVEDVKVKAEKKEAIAWGKEVDGLQIGLIADADNCRQGEKLKLTVKLRNVDKADIKFTHGLLREYAPEVNAAGGAMSVYMPLSRGYKVRLVERVIKPGETITLYKPEIAVESEARARLKGIMRVDTPTICVAPGKYKTEYGGMIQSHPKLATGTVEFEVNDQVAWGKEVKGLQIGLVLTDARSYQPGEKVKMEVKVRNVSKASVTITYGRLSESPPQITYPKGGEVNVQMPPIILFIVIPSEKIIEPGKTVTLYNPEVAVAERLRGQIGPEPFVSTPTIRVQPGKYKIGYSSMVHSHPTLATGTVEFEVQKPAAEKAVTVWGKEVDGLQIGLEGAHAVQQGEKAKFAVKLRNVGKAEVTITYQVLRERAPQVTTSDGGKVSVFMPAPKDNLEAPKSRVVKPGETIDLYKPEVAVEPEAMMRLEGIIRVTTPTICVDPGKYKIAYGGMIQSHPKLATGALEFEVKAKKNVTAWGKEIDGVQVGILFDEDRIYKVGETVTLTVRLRNNRKKDVPFSYYEEYFQKNPPLITDADGKAVKIKARRIWGIIENSSVAPGKEVDLCKMPLDLRPDADRKKDGNRPAVFAAVRRAA